jgi:uncharacterized phage-like protein YoqJ
MTTVAITGHRPERIPDMDAMAEALRESFLELEVTKVIQGMAAGIDLLAAKTAYNLHVPFVSARPWAGHYCRKEDEYDYLRAIQKAEEVVIIHDSEKYPGPWVYQKRNEWMVDRAELVIAVWDGEPKGGTYNCVKYAHDVKKLPICMIHPEAGYGVLYESGEPLA